MKRLFTGIAAVLSLVILTGCQDEAETVTARDDYLAHIPADTPYVMTNLRRSSVADMKEFIDKAAPLFERQIALYSELFEQDQSLTPEERQRLQAVFESIAAEFKDGFTVETLEAKGLRVDAYWAIYGSGMLPVMRLELGDSEKFKATIQRLADNNQISLAKDQFEGKDYWYVDPDAEQGDVRLVFAVQGLEFVAGLTPKAYQEDFLHMLFALKLPERSLADSGELQQMAETHQLVGEGLGFVHLQRIVESMTDQQSSRYQKTWKAAGLDLPAMDEQCKTEITGLIKTMPRLAVGYTEFSTQAINSKLVLELEPELAAELKQLVVPVAGLGSYQGLLSIGYGLDLGKSQQLMDQYAAQLRQQPLKCPHLAELNRNMQQSTLPPMAYAFQGAHLVMNEVDLQQGQDAFAALGSLKALASIQTTSPEGLIGMLAMFQPQLAQMKLAADGIPVPIPPAILPPIVAAPHIAMGNNVLGVSIGEGNEQKLQAFISDPAGENPPFFSLFYNMAALGELLDQSSQTMAAAMPPKDRQIFQQQMSLMGLNDLMIENVAMNFYFTDKGIEVLYDSQLK